MYRHPHETHGALFHAIANISQLTLEAGEHLFDVEYDSNDI
jgi:hypothetical protein